MKWKLVCFEKKTGGALGVRSLRFLNKALLCIWNGFFTDENGPIWKRVINVVLDVRCWRSKEIF